MMELLVVLLAYEFVGLRCLLGVGGFDADLFAVSGLGLVYGCFVISFVFVGGLAGFGFVLCGLLGVS